MYDKYAVNEVGVQCLRQMSRAVSDSIPTFSQLVGQIMASAEEHSEALGPHRLELYNALKDIADSLKKAAEPAENIADILNDVADAYDEIIGNSRLRNFSNQQPVSAPSGAGAGKSGGIKSFISGLFRSNDSSSHTSSSLSGTKTAPALGGLPVDKAPNGTWRIAGTGHDAFLAVEKSCEFSCQNYSSPVVTEVDPSKIEGIDMLSDRDISEPSFFWQQHKREGSLESFLEIASHIPEVKERLARGESLVDLQYDDVLGSCVGIYFSPESAAAPTLYEGDGYYELNGNGRHRVIAARILGHSFPIRIIGKIQKKDTPR